MADEKIRYVLDVDDQGTPKLVKFGQASEKAGKQASKAMADTSKGLEEVGNQIPVVGNAMGLMAAGPFAAALAGSVALVGGLAMVTKQGIDYADSMNDMADRTGLAVETLSRLKLVSELGGTSLEEVAKILGKFSSKVAEGDKGIKSLNLTAKDSAGAMIEVADKVKAAKTQTEAIAIAQAAYGKQWQEMMPILKMGGDEIKRISENTPVVTAEMAQMSAKFNDTMAEMKTRLGGVGLALSMQILPHMLTWVQRLEKVVDLAGKFGSSATGKRMLSAAGGGLLSAAAGVIPGGQMALAAYRMAGGSESKAPAAVASPASPVVNGGGVQVKTPEEIEAERKAQQDAAKKRKDAEDKAFADRLAQYYKELEVRTDIEQQAQDFLQQGVDLDNKIAAEAEAEAIKRGDERVAAHNAMIDRMAEGWRSYYDEVAAMRQKEADEFEASMTQRLGMHNEQLTLMIRGKQSAADTMANIEDATKNYAVQKGLEFLEEWVAQQLTMAVFGDAMRAAEVAKANATGAAQAAAYAPAAATASVASWGSAAVVGGAALAAVLAQFAFRETGGSTLSGGRDMIVGERGAETFRATRPGQIINQHNTTNQGATITINVASMSAADIARIQRQGVRTRAQGAR